MARGPSTASPAREGPRVNDNIQTQRVRLVNATGENVGIVGLEEALGMADEAGLDLVEVSPNADPPVCKILDYGKYKYEAQKKKNEARKKQKTIEVKEVKLRPNIDENDYRVKINRMRKFFGEGDKVKVTLRFRGREVTHQEIAANLMSRVQEEVDDLAKVEQNPKMEGRAMIMILAPR